VKRALLALPLLLAACGIQPTKVITGTPSTGAVLYMIQINRPVPVVRMTRTPLSPAGALALLASGPTAVERDMGFTSQVPNIDRLFTVEGNTITVPIELDQLSAIAMDQIVCTAAIPRPVTLIGDGQTRRSAACPV
jgi:hypothetical protein